MKKLYSLLFLLASMQTFAQDTSKVASPPDTSKAKLHGCRFNHEVGVNVTSLLKQVFGLSNTNFPNLPYDITYKLIRKTDKWAIRTGFGILLNNSSVKTSSTLTGASPVPGPDPIVPTVTNSMNLFFRGGWERRYTLHPKILVYAGADVAGQYGYSHSKSSQLFNDLPSSYSFTRTRVDRSTVALGGGPVAGIQFFVLKNLSLFTEMPLYFQYTMQKDELNNYQNQMSSFSGNFVSSESKEKVTTRMMKVSVTLPVTLYLALKF